MFVDRAATTPSAQLSTMITDQNTISVPGLGTNLDITFVSQGTQPSISMGGYTAFDINVSPGPNKQVVLTKGPLAVDLLRVVSYEGTPIPGTTSDTVLVAASPRSIATNGDVGFRASTASATAGSSGMFRWDAQTSALELVAHTDQPIVGTSDLFNLIANATNQPFAAEFGDTARSAFRATLKQIGVPGTTGTGVWVDGPVAGLTSVHDTSDNAPGVFNPPMPFLDFHAPAVSSLGQVAFRACLSLGCGDDGIWSGLPGAVTLVARRNDPALNAVGEDLGEDFLAFSDPVLNEDGSLAFRAEKTGSYPEGIWRRASQFGGGLWRIVQKGDTLRGTNLQFVSFDEDLTISDSGELAFTATMSNNEKGLFTTVTLGVNPLIVKVVLEGEAFPYSSSQDKVVNSFQFHPGAYAMGSTGFVHMASLPAQPQAIGFAVTYADFTRSIVLSTVE